METEKSKIGNLNEHNALIVLEAVLGLMTPEQLEKVAVMVSSMEDSLKSSVGSSTEPDLEFELKDFSPDCAEKYIR